MGSITGPGVGGSVRNVVDLPLEIPVEIPAGEKVSVSVDGDGKIDKHIYVFGPGDVGPVESLLALPPPEDHEGEWILALSADSAKSAAIVVEDPTPTAGTMNFGTLTNAILTTFWGMTIDLTSATLGHDFVGRFVVDGVDYTSDPVDDTFDFTNTGDNNAQIAEASRLIFALINPTAQGLITINYQNGVATSPTTGPTSEIKFGDAQEVIPGGGGVDLTNPLVTGAESGKNGSLSEIDGAYGGLDASDHYTLADWDTSSAAFAIHNHPGTAFQNQRAVKIWAIPADLNGGTAKWTAETYPLRDSWIFINSWSGTTTNPYNGDAAIDTLNDLARAMFNNGPVGRNLVDGRYMWAIDISSGDGEIQWVLDDSDAGIAANGSRIDGAISTAIQSGVRDAYFDMDSQLQADARDWSTPLPTMPTEEMTVRVKYVPRVPVWQTPNDGDYDYFELVTAPADMTYGKGGLDILEIGDLAQYSSATSGWKRGVFSEVTRTSKVREVTDFAATSGTSTITSPSGAFVVEDQGSYIVIGTNGYRIQTYVSATEVTIDSTVQATVSGASGYIGVDAYGASDWNFDYPFPQDSVVEVVQHFVMDDGEGGSSIRAMVRTYGDDADEYGPDGSGWKVVVQQDGDAFDIAWSKASDLYIGLWNPAFELIEAEIFNGWLDGTRIASPSAALAIAEDPAGETAFDDAEGNTWTPNTNASAIDPNAVDAADVSYDNTTSGLTATNVKAALDELKALIDALP